MTSQSKSWRSWLAALCAVALVSMASPVWAVFPEIETFDNDTDTWDPTPGLNAFDDPNVVPSDPPPVGEWRDARTTGAGVLEEVPAGFDPYGTAGPTGDIPTGAFGGDNMGVLWWEDGNGPFGFPAYSVDRNYSAWSRQVDFYTDSRAVIDGDGVTGNGTPDFWWTSSLNPAGEDGYLTETGFTGEVKMVNDEKVWRMTSTGGGNPFFDAPVDTWLTLEVVWHDYGFDTEGNIRDEEGAAGRLAADLLIWNDTHTELLHSMELVGAALDGNSPNLQVDQMGGPGYSWFVFNGPELEHITIDNVGVGLRVGLGDMNNDGFTDFGDIEAFEVALTDPEAYITNYNAPLWQKRGDINNDGFFDFGDIEQYEILLVGGIPQGSPPLVLGGASSVPEPGSMTLLGLGLVGLAIAYRRRRRA